MFQTLSPAERGFVVSGNELGTNLKNFYERNSRLSLPPVDLVSTQPGTEFDDEIDMNTKLQMLFLRLVTLPELHQEHAIERLSKALADVELHVAEYETQEESRRLAN